MFWVSEISIRYVLSTLAILFNIHDLGLLYVLYDYRDVIDETAKAMIPGAAVFFLDQFQVLSQNT